MVLGFGQYLVGGLAVLLVLQPLLGVDPLMACLIEVGFEGGHGTAAGMGPTFRSLGLASGEALGLAMATVGVLAAVLIGSSLVVIGRRRQWLLAAGDPDAEAALEAQRLAERERQRPAHPSPTLDSLTLNLALIGGAVGLGVLLKHALVLLWGAGSGAKAAAACWRRCRCSRWRWWADCWCSSCCSGRGSPSWPRCSSSRASAPWPWTC
jgi:ESS family glutamate:Na+ symporter